MSVLWVVIIGVVLSLAPILMLWKADRDERKMMELYCKMLADPKRYLPEEEREDT